MLESLAAIDREAGLELWLSEVKSPVMDKLRRSDFFRSLGHRVFLTHQEAVQTLIAGGDRR